ncbi:NADPH dehydrogenase NamA [Halpernia frigidisoli]|uniref:2,4-dienoyl-CoA reductase n=1 Tax=Halpernia frigidisoli TaxID=1125876 RepID=A0A1I3FMA9_9FLAO|nr:NADPH dehydrogenase NamA [Halpernia frigidisoli]SFI12353.1 2,4-dienoyl-CoA reductase [Halpernia frigidisoli]
MLYNPIKFRNLELPNRWVMSPMCMYSSENGVATDFHYVHYGSRAQGGTGLIMVEATAVVPEGRITPKCMGIWNDEQAAKLGEIVKFIKNNTKSKTAIQLAHAGRKSSTWENKQLTLDNGGWETSSASDIPYDESERKPNSLTVEEIKETVQQFKIAAQRSVDVGFDIIEIHAAHGYLVHQFLSPLSNTRMDEYGGNLENRSRILVEIVDAVNEVLDENHPLFVRISATEYAENGWDLEESIELSKILKSKNVDLIDVSSGGNIQGAKIPVFPGYQVPFCEEIKKEADIATGAVGLITSTEQAEGILLQNKADLIFVAREMLRNPYLAVEGSFIESEDCFFPHQYDRARI